MVHRMKTGLIVVDMQYDFINGTLAVPGAWDIVLAMQEYIALFEAHGLGSVYYTACAHPANHCSFVENGGKWPAHCVEGTFGARLQSGLAAMAYGTGKIIRKGTVADVDEYDGFATGELYALMRADGVSAVEVCGLARDYCVAATAATAASLFMFPGRVTILEELSRAVGR